MNPIHLRNLPPPLETFDHCGLLRFIAEWLKPERYLELGVRHGDSLFSVAPLAEEVYAVDIKPFELRYGGLPENVIPFIESTDDFFKRDLPEFDMVFIDAFHERDQVIRDFDNVLKHVIEDGIIFLHDTYPYGEEMINPELCNNCWEAALYIKNNYDVEIVTLPFNPGVTIIKKTPKHRQIIWKDTPR